MVKQITKGCKHCGGLDFWFDRTMEPPCDSMHSVCEDCGKSVPCGDPECRYAETGLNYNPNVMQEQPNNINKEKLEIATRIAEAMFRGGASYSMSITVSGYALNAAEYLIKGCTKNE